MKLDCMKQLSQLSHRRHLHPMQTALPPLRTCCSARNAYRPAAAIVSTLASHGLNIIDADLLRRRNVAPSRRWRIRLERVPRRRLSTTALKCQEASAVVGEETGQGEPRRDAKKARASIRLRTLMAQGTVGDFEENPWREDLPYESPTKDKNTLGTGDTFANLEGLTNSPGQHQFTAHATASSHPSNFRITYYEGERENPTPKGLSRRPIRQPNIAGQERTPADVRHREPAARGVVANEAPISVVGKRKLRAIPAYDDPEIGRYLWQRDMQLMATQAHNFRQKETSLSDPASVEKYRKELDYDGKYVKIMRSPLALPLPVPWTAGVEKDAPQHHRTLGREVQLFRQYMEMTEAERAARDSIISELMALIKRCSYDEKCGAEVFGSEKTGLALPTSDIDVRLTWRNSDAKFDKGPLVPFIRDVAAELRKSNDFICVVLRYAKYPIINVQHRVTGLDVQIVAGQSTAPQEEVVRQYLEELPYLRHLYMVIKTALLMRGLTDAFYGGTGSYGLIVMLAACLRRKRFRRPQGLRIQLLQLLKFYSEIDMSKHGIGTFPAKLFKKHDADELPLQEFSDAALRRNDPVRAGQWQLCRRSPVQPYLLCLQDPANPTNDLGRNGTAIKHVQATLGALRLQLEQQEQWVEDPRSNARRGKYSLNRDTVLEALVGRVHEVHYEQRRRLEKYGSEVLAERKSRVLELRLDVEKEILNEPLVKEGGQSSSLS